MQYLYLILRLIQLTFQILSLIIIFPTTDTCLLTENMKISMYLRLGQCISILFLLFYL